MLRIPLNQAYWAKDYFDLGGELPEEKQTNTNLQAEQHMNMELELELGTKKIIANIPEMTSGSIKGINKLISNFQRNVGDMKWQGCGQGDQDAQ